MTMWTDHLKKCAKEYQTLKKKRQAAIKPVRRITGKKTLQNPTRRQRSKYNAANDID
jgi:hypothetical protein